MKTYNIYFEIYGKKMKTVIKANSEQEAKEIIKNNIKFIKIVPENNIDFLKNIFGM
jgi:hypothetical protein